MHISEAQLSQKSYWNRGILIEWLQLPSNEKAKQSTEEERGEPPTGLLSPWPYARHHTKRQGFVGEQGGEMSRPMGGLRWQLKPEHSFSIEFSWHTASNAFSCRTARKKIKVVLISSNMKKKKKKRRHYRATALLYWLTKRKKERIYFYPTQEEPCLFLILNSKPLHKEKESKLTLALSSHALEAYK